MSESIVEIKRLLTEVIILSSVDDIIMTAIGPSSIIIGNCDVEDDDVDDDDDDDDGRTNKAGGDFVTKADDDVFPPTRNIRHNRLAARFRNMMELIDGWLDGWMDLTQT